MKGGVRMGTFLYIVWALFIMFGTSFIATKLLFWLFDKMNIPNPFVAAVDLIRLVAKRKQSTAK